MMPDKIPDRPKTPPSPLLGGNYEFGDGPKDTNVGWFVSHVEGHLQAKANMPPPKTLMQKTTEKLPDLYNGATGAAMTALTLGAKAVEKSKDYLIGK